MSKARDRMVEKRLCHGLDKNRSHRKRRISRFWEGRVRTGLASTHKLRWGRLYNLRLRLWRRFHTVLLIDGATRPQMNATEETLE